MSVCERQLCARYTIQHKTVIVVRLIIFRQPCSRVTRQLFQRNHFCVNTVVANRFDVCDAVSPKNPVVFRYKVSLMWSNTAKIPTSFFSGISTVRKDSYDNDFTYAIIKDLKISEDPLIGKNSSNSCLNWLLANHFWCNCPIHIADADCMRLNCLVASSSAVWIGNKKTILNQTSKQ